MESYKGGLKGYWKRREYERVDGSRSGRRRLDRVELGDGRRRRRFWRIRISPKLRFLRRVASPRRILTWIRDAYVRMMLSFADSGALAGGYGFTGDGAAGFGRRPVKEYDEKMLVEIYRSIISQGHVIAAAGGGGEGGGAVQVAVKL